MTLIAFVFPKLQPAKEVVRQNSKKPVPEHPASQHVKGSQTVLKPAGQCFYHIFNKSEGNWVGKCLS